MTPTELVHVTSEILDLAATQALIDLAVETQATVTFYRDAARAQILLTANVLDHTRTYLELLGPNDEDQSSTRRVNCLASAILELDGKRYSFLAELEHIGERQGRSHWRIDIPSDIRPLIRRTPRLRPKTSTAVSVRPIHDSGAGVTATLLNVSEEGMACRLPASPQDGITRDRMVHLTFQLPDIDETFELAADVMHRQAAGTEGYDIVGLQFCKRRAAVPALRRLSGALAKMT